MIDEVLGRKGRAAENKSGLANGTMTRHFGRSALSWYSSDIP